MTNAPNSIINSPDQHGFVMAGTETLFLCHLAMFPMQAHMYQVILEVRLPEYAMNQYVIDRKQHWHEAYILGNVEYDLMTLVQIQNGQLKSFIADIFRGMPEDPNKDTPLIHNVRVTIERIVYFRHFDYNMDYPNSLTYVLFGSGNEAHMTHYMTKEPDFNQVLDLAEAPNWLPPGQLEAGIQVNIPSLNGHTMFCSNPLTKTSYEVQFYGQEPLHTINVGSSYWFSTDSLNAKDPCAGS